MSNLNLIIPDVYSLLEDYLMQIFVLTILLLLFLFFSSWSIFSVLSFFINHIYCMLY